MSQICSKMVIFLFSAYFGGHFCYHSNRKSRINTRPLHFGYCSNKMKKVNKQCLLDTPHTVRVSEKTWQVIVQTRRP